MPAPPDPLLKTCVTQEPMSLKAATNVYLVTPTNTLQTELPIVPNVLLPMVLVVLLVTLVNVQVSPPAVATISTATPLEPMPALPLQAVPLMPAAPSDALSVHLVTT